MVLLTVTKLGDELYDVKGSGADLGVIKYALMLSISDEPFFVFTFLNVVNGSCAYDGLYLTPETVIKVALAEYRYPFMIKSNVVTVEYGDVVDSGNGNGNGNGDGDGDGNGNGEGLSGAAVAVLAAVGLVGVVGLYYWLKKRGKR